jgi:beta-glucosidase
LCINSHIFENISHKIKFKFLLSMHNTNIISLMKKRFFVLYTLLLCTGFVVTGQLVAQTNQLNAEIESKVDSVLALMTIEEKAGQMNQHNGSWEFTGPVPEGDYQQERYELLKKGMVGSVLNVTGAAATREAQRIVMENSRLKIPLMFGYDVIHGYKTIFPVPLAEVASWDMEALEKSAHIAAVEAAASGITWTFAPMIDLSRDARWGRIVEGGGEDPVLGAAAAVARVKGFQGSDLSSMNTIAATAKHFAGYGFSEAGRDYNTIEVSENTLLNVILPPFKAASDAGVASVMNAFNDVLDVPATGSEYLQRKILKGDWGFEGVIVSDWWSIKQMVTHGYSEDLKMSALHAITAGNDIDMESEAYQRHLVELVKEGKVDEKIVDEAVRRILRMKFRLGLFDDPYKYSNEEREKSMQLTKEHLAVAHDVAKKSIVLLKNEGNVLPVKASVKSIAVIGALASDKDSPIGTWRAQAIPNSAISMLEGIQAAVGKNVEVKYAQGYTLVEGERAFIRELNFVEDDGSGFADAIKIAKDADIVLMAMGEEGFQTGEGRSQVDVSLKGRQLELFQKILEVNKNTAVVLMNGRPIIEPELYTSAPAIVEAWHLGSMAGHAIADVLFGKYNPSGKMPVSIPRHVGQIPMYYNHKNTGRPGAAPGTRDDGTVFWSHYTDESNEPQYPFGYGLSYTSFTYSEPMLSATSMKLGEEVTLSVDVTNSGKLDGEEVVQFYIHDHYASLIRPVIELKGFQKIALKAGETKRVSFKVDEKVLGFYGFDKTFKAEPGSFTLMVGTNSDDVKEVAFELLNK